MSRDRLLKAARERRQHYLSLPQDEHHRLLVPRTATNHWSNTTGTYSKDNVPLLVTGRKDDKWEKDRVKMERHLKFSSLDQAMFPEKEPFKRMFNPLDVPILDILAVETERDYGWQYPSKETMMGLQANRGLARAMLRRCEVREIVLNGGQSEEDQKDIINWHYKQLAKDQEQMPGAPLSLDVEQVPCTLMDVFEICGQRRHKGDYVKLHTKPGPDYHGRHADRHIQFPCRLMWGNGVTWAVMVTILTDPVTKGNHTTHEVKKFKVPEYIINLLEGLPLSI